MDFGKSSSIMSSPTSFLTHFSFILRDFYTYINPTWLVHKTFFFNEGILGILIQKADMYRMLVLASVFSHNSKWVAEDLFLSIFHKKLLDFVSNQQESTSVNLLIGGKFHKKLLFKSFFLSPDFTLLGEA